MRLPCSALWTALPLALGLWMTPFHASAATDRVVRVAAADTAAIVDDALVHVLMALDSYSAGDLPATRLELDTALEVLLATDLPRGEAGLKRLNQQLPTGYQGFDLVRIYRETAKHRKAVEVTPQASADEKEVGGPQGLGEPPPPAPGEEAGRPAVRPPEDVPLKKAKPSDATVAPDAPATEYLSDRDMAFVRKEIEAIVAAFGEKSYPHSEVFEQQVAYFIKLYQTSLRGFFERSLMRSIKYMPTVQARLKERGVPEAMAYIAFVESGFRPNAASSVGAVGLWQFMPRTARAYGLKVEKGIDDRLDPEKATVAAREYFLDLVAIFGSNSFLLAMASYNAGEGKVQYCLKQLDDPFNKRNFWEIRSCLRQETREYIPRIIAAAIVAEDPERFGFGQISPYLDEDRYELVSIPFPLSLSLLATLAEVPVSALRAANADLGPKDTTTPRDMKRYQLLVPKGRRQAIEEEIAVIAARKEEEERVAAAERAKGRSTKGKKPEGGTKAVAMASREPDSETGAEKSGPGSERATDPTEEPERAVGAAKTEKPAKSAGDSEKPVATAKTDSPSRSGGEPEMPVATAKTASVSKSGGESEKPVTTEKTGDASRSAAEPTKTVDAAETTVVATTSTLKPEDEGALVSVSPERTSKAGAKPSTTKSAGKAGQKAPAASSPEPAEKPEPVAAKSTGKKGTKVAKVEPVATREEAEEPIYDDPPRDDAGDRRSRFIRYRVQPGNSLSQIARDFRTPVDKLRGWNPQLKGRDVKAGDQVFIYELDWSLEKHQHPVVKGDTLASVAKRYKVDPARIQRWNGLSGQKLTPGADLVIYAYSGAGRTAKVDAQDRGDRASSPRSGKETPPKRQAVVYEVQPGNNLSVIAAMFEVDFREIMKWNDLSSGRLQPGQKLTLYPSRKIVQERYTVKRGDTVPRLAQRYRLDPGYLRAANGLEDTESLKSGQVLVVYKMSR